MTMVRRRFIVVVLVATATSALQWRAVGASGATISLAGLNFSAVGVPTDNLSAATSAITEAASEWQDKSSGFKPTFETDRRNVSSPLKQLFQSRAQDIFPTASQQPGNDAYHSDISRVLGPLMAASALMPLSDNACSAIDSVAMSAMPSQNAMPRRWSPISASPLEQPKAAKASSIAAAPSQDRRGVMPAAPIVTPNIKAPTLKSLIVALPAAIGLSILLGCIFWQYARYRRSLALLETATAWPEEIAAEDADRAAQSVLLVNLVQRENRRAARMAKVLPMTVSTAKEEIRRAA